MSNDKRLSLLFAIAISAAAGAAIAATSRRKQIRATQDQQHKTHVRTWESEGGNLAPTEAAAALA
jgi:hypothetical protein